MKSPQDTKMTDSSVTQCLSALQRCPNQTGYNCIKASILGTIQEYCPYREYVH